MTRYVVLGEDKSDAECIQVLIRKVAGDSTLSVLIKGYDGCANLLKKGAVDLDFYNLRRNCDRFVVAYDADRDDPAARWEEVRSKVVGRSRVAEAACCIVVPVQELEAWLLADLAAAGELWKGWRPASIENPEAVRDPKEHLEKLSRDAQRRPRYSHAVDNPRLARKVDVAVLERKCPSFRVLAEFVRANR